MLGWGVAGVANAVFVGRLSSARTAVDRALHHLADFGEFALLGLLAGGLRAGVCAAARRLPGKFGASLALRLAAAVILLAPIGAWAARGDLTNFMERSGLPAWVPVRACGGLALAGLYVALGYLVERLLARTPRSSGFILAVVLVVAANLALPSDYLGPRVLAVALAARVAGLELARSALPWMASPRTFLAAVALGFLGVAQLVVPPRASTWQRVFLVPGSVAPELLGFALEPRSEQVNAWVPPESAAWFRDRSREPDRAPTRALDLPANTVFVVLTIDALRADVLASHDHDAQLPALAALRDRSVRFTNARSPSPSTLTTVMALLTSRYYSQTYWSGDGARAYPKQDRSLRWTRLLADRGVRTVHVMSLHGLGTQNGVGAGFEVERRTRKDYGPAREVADIVIEELGQMGGNPGVVYAHFVDSHAPYTLGGKEGTPFERYLKEVALVDRAVGRVVDALAEPGLRGRAALIVSADHGEAFGEHGKNHHASSVYDELLRVPLYFDLPGIRAASVDAPVSLVDLGPTLLDCFALPTPATFMGESLAPLLAGKPAKLTRPIVADAGRRIQAMVFADGTKAVRDLMHNTIEIYDLNRDPKELENRSGMPDFPADRYAGALAHFFDVHTLKKSGWKPPWRKF
ncbi:MAG TPA: sulfatase [Polyangiaceae bacterium]